MAVLIEFPAKAAFGRVVPKEKIYSHAKLSRSLREKFVAQLGKIVWQYKLAPETINLAAKRSVPEIEIFDLHLKTGELSDDVLLCIDKAIPFPILFRLVYEGRIKVMAAYKRPSEADADKWVVDGYFASDWVSASDAHDPMPVALDLGRLYEQLLRRIMPLPSRAGESLKDHVARLDRIRAKEHEIARMASRLNKEKQFNKKVELNAHLRQLKSELQALMN
ncbi:MAG: DUF4391 domain-containing protein [Desulfuromonadales bacterium]